MNKVIIIIGNYPQVKICAKTLNSMLQEMMERALVKQRAGIVQKQVAAGREFKVRNKHGYMCYAVLQSSFLEPSR